MVGGAISARHRPLVFHRGGRARRRRPYLRQDHRAFRAALEPGSAEPRFWPLRLAPSLAVAPFLAVGWTRGQTTTIIVFLMVAFLARYAESRRVLASLALATAIAIKMFPAAALIFPAMRREFRFVAYVLAFVFALLFLVPAACVGFHETVGLYHAQWTEHLQGILSGRLTPRIQGELSPWAVSIVSVGSMLARTFSTPSPDAPYDLPLWARAAQLAFDAAMLSTIVAASYGRAWRFRRPQPSDPYPFVFAGALLLAALPPMLSVARPNYWALQIPLITCLYAESTARRGTLKLSRAEIAWVVAAIVSFFATGNNSPGILAPLGPTTIVMFAPIVAGVAALRRLPAREGQPAETSPVSGLGGEPARTG